MAPRVDEATLKAGKQHHSMGHDRRHDHALVRIKWQESELAWHVTRGAKPSSQPILERAHRDLMARTPTTPPPAPTNIDSGRPLLTPAEAAELLSTTARNLGQQRFEHRGPAYVKLGGKIGYRLSDIDAYIMRSLVQPRG